MSIFFYFKEIGVGEFKKIGEGPKHISEDCIQQCAMLCLNIPGTHKAIIAVVPKAIKNYNNVFSLIEL